MIPGLPVFDLGKFVYGGLKLVVFSAMVLWLNSFTPQLTAMLNEAKDRAFDGLNGLLTVDLGCISSLIGLDTVMNGVLNSIYVAGAFYVSSVITILAFKYAITIFGIGMKI